MFIRLSLICLAAMCVAATSPQATAIHFTSNGHTLRDGTYYRGEWIDRKTSSYSINRVWDNPPIFGGFEFRRTNNGYYVKVGNLHEELAEFAFFDDGRLMSEKECRAAVGNNWCATPCAFGECISHITLIDSSHLVARIAGKEIRFESIAGLKEVQK